MADDATINGVYFDTNVLIEAFEDKTRQTFSYHAVRRAEEGEYIIVLSSFSITEFLASKNLLPEDIEQFTSFHESDHVFVQELTRQIADEAAQICRERANILPADGVHMATALHRKVPVLLTSDGKPPTNKRRQPRAMIALDGKLSVTPLTRLRVITPKDHDHDFASKSWPLQHPPTDD